MDTLRMSSDRKNMEGKKMFPITNNTIKNLQCFFTIVSLTLFLCLSMAGMSSAASQKEFVSPSAAALAFIAALEKNDERELLAIFGPDAEELISSGDEVDDLASRRSFLEAYNEQNRIISDMDKQLLVIGKREWPFPIPLVKRKDMWVFDTSSGKDEILNRRIGRNELNTIQVLLAIVDAQREYAIEDRDNDTPVEYAQKFNSTPGKKDGLYWETKMGEEESPLGKLVANARAEGYGSEGSKDGSTPYQGYYYRIMTAQGSNAPGGAYDYIVNGRMIGGFAVVAYPAEYGNSGIMTFIVNHDGKVYQKDLGENSAELANAMMVYDPDNTWEIVQ